jgi:hypothetical protein
MKARVLFLFLFILLLVFASAQDSEVVSEQDALDSIEQIKIVISEMKSEELPIGFFEDKLLEAERVFEQAKLAEVLRDEKSTPFQKKQARESLQLVDWKEITFQDVLDVEQVVIDRRSKTLEVFDEISIAKFSLPEEKKSKGIGSEIFGSPPEEDLERSRILGLVGDIELAFEEERFDDVESLLEEYREETELKRAEQAISNRLKSNITNFFQRNWPFVLVALGVLYFFGRLSHKKVSKSLLKKKVEKMKAERKTLTDMMRKAQEERFKLNKISELVYGIRIGKYKSRLEEIKQELPVIEGRLRSGKKKV